MANTDKNLEQGIKFKQVGNYDNAVAEFLAAITNNNRNVEAHRQLGLVYGFTGLFDESIQELETAVNLDPNNVNAKIDLAMTYAMLGMYNNAKDGFRKCYQSIRKTKQLSNRCNICD